jgi:hypothetical protein
MAKDHISLICEYTRLRLEELFTVVQSSPRQVHQDIQETIDGSPVMYLGGSPKCAMVAA